MDGELGDDSDLADTGDKASLGRRGHLEQARRRRGRSRTRRAHARTTDETPRAWRATGKDGESWELKRAVSSSSDIPAPLVHLLPPDRQETELHAGTSA